MDVLSTPIVSIVTPSYNHAPYIRQTIDSVLSQDWPHIEQIVMDGGSTDGTVEILREYGDRYPDRFRWVSERDRGQSHAFNKGLAMARGEFIGWQNSDDYYYPNVFGEPLRYLIAHPAVDIVYSELAVVGEARSTLWHNASQPFAYSRLRENNCIPNQSAFVRRDALLSCAGLNEDLHFTMDYDLWLRMTLCHRAVYLPGVRGAWRMLPTVKTVASYQRALRERVLILERALADTQMPPDLVPHGRHALQSHIFNALLEDLLHDDQPAAAEMLAKSLAYDPDFSQWQRFCRLLFVQGRMAQFWSGEADEHAQRVPSALLAQLVASGLRHRSATSRVRAIAYIARSLGTAPPSSAAMARAYLLLASRADPPSFTYLAGMALLLKLFRGERLHTLLDLGASYVARRPSLPWGHSPRQ